MAGIGFELKKLFAEKGLILNARANLYASIVITGPMLLGAVLLFAIKYMAFYAGASNHEQDILVVMVTYSVLFALLLTSCVTFVATRYVADMLYEDKNERVLPSMYGAISICLVAGAVIWGTWLLFNWDVPFQWRFFSFVTVLEAIVVWIQMSYVNAAKDYRSALIGFGSGITLGLLVGYFLIWVLHQEIISSLLAGVCVAYGVMLIGFTVVLHGYFPIGVGSSLKFLEWVEKFPSLVMVGFFLTAGLFVHVFIMWHSPWGIHVIGLFYHCPAYDIPALLAMMTTLPTIVNFVTSVELAFYPRYRLYFSLLNGGSSLSDLEKAKRDMGTVLKQELFYIGQIQLFVELICIALAGGVLPRLRMGFTPEMIGLFRVLCVGYGLYIISNSMVLFLLYLSDYQDAMATALTLFIFSGVCTFITTLFPHYYYGFGFVLASLGMFAVAWIQLSAYINHLDYNIFCKQPIFLKEHHGWLTRLARRLDSHNGSPEVERAQ